MAEFTHKTAGQLAYELMNSVHNFRGALSQLQDDHRHDDNVTEWQFIYAQRWWDKLFEIAYMLARQFEYPYCFMYKFADIDIPYIIELSDADYPEFRESLIQRYSNLDIECEKIQPFLYENEDGHEGDE